MYHIALYFSCFIETEGLFKVAGNAVTYTVEVVISREWCEIEMLLLLTTSRKSFMTHGIVAILMTFSDLEGRAPCSDLEVLAPCSDLGGHAPCTLHAFHNVILYSCAEVDKTTDITCHAVPLQ